ncbi:serine hydrolase domain-containing protein [Lysobacter silvisoli]|uniref:Class A beta-lactamase-related serine hydrolase n=1 Tax=Lysobacter silvisoli TaxID=2293254 RepID=A0A371K2D2_9GAMM|nr:serine hydrolase domain-containing protein [Lysobacter silvisoli]RDZ28075.1 class A beta-lactamase-related serine hydrolase [Lysobacter silvisoli]
MNNRRPRLILSAALTLAAVPAFAADADTTRTAELKARFDAAIPALLQRTQVSSVSVARMEHGRLVFAAAYGEQAAGQPATVRTVYNIASMTKPVSAEIVLRLASEGKLDLDRPMSPDWVDPDVAADPRHELLTPRLALSHRSGFANWRYQTDGKLRFDAAPGEKVGYSGEGYEYVARYAEKRAGQPFDALLRERLFVPLGMQDTSYKREPSFEGRIAVPHDAQGKTLDPDFYAKGDWQASDELYTTPSDYVRFMAAVARHQGVSDALARQRRQVQASTREQQCEGKRAQGCPAEMGYGLGWEVMRYDQRTYLVHSGSDAGEFTLGYLDPADGSGTVIFTNNHARNGHKVIAPIIELIGRDPQLLQFALGRTDP